MFLYVFQRSFQNQQFELSNDLLAHVQAQLCVFEVYITNFLQKVSGNHVVISKSIFTSVYLQVCVFIWVCQIFFSTRIMNVVEFLLQDPQKISLKKNVLMLPIIFRRKLHANYLAAILSSNQIFSLNFKFAHIKCIIHLSL